MATSPYTTTDFVNEYLGVADATSAEIVTASRDLDRVINLNVRDDVTTDDLNLVDSDELEDSAQAFLAQAVSEQVSYRRVLPDEIFALPSIEADAPPKISPEARDLLIRAGLFSRLRKARQSQPRPWRSCASDVTYTVGWPW